MEDFMVEVNVLLTGETFGEYSLISNQPTQAWIKCKEDCHFAILEKKDFNNILRESRKINWSSNLELFGKMPIFKVFSDGQIQNFLVNFTEKHCKRNFLVFQEQQASDEIYFIGEGEFLIFKTFEINAKKPENDTFEQKTLSFVKENKKNKKGVLKLCVLLKGEYVGFEDVLTRQKRSFGLKCISMDGGKLYSIKKENFIRKMKEDPNVYAYLVKDTEEKIQRLESRYNFGLEVNNIKMNIFEKQEHQNRFLPIIIKNDESLTNIKNANKSKNSGSQSYREQISKNNEKSNLTRRNSQSGCLIELEKKKKHEEFMKEFKAQKKLISEFPWMKEKRSISLLNNLEEYIEMQNKGNNKNNDCQHSFDLNMSKLSKIKKV